MAANIKPLVKLILIIACLLPAIALCMTVYKSTDANGNVSFSQNPTPNSTPIDIPDPQSISLPNNSSSANNNTTTTTSNSIVNTAPSTATDPSAGEVQQLNQQIDAIQQLQQQIQQAGFAVNSAQAAYDAANAKVQDLVGQKNYSLVPGQQLTQPTTVQGSKGVNTTATLDQAIYNAKQEQLTTYQNLQQSEQYLNNLKQQLIQLQQNQ